MPVVDHEENVLLKAEPPPAASWPRWLIPGRRGLGLILVFAVLLVPSVARAATMRARVNSPDGLNLRAAPTSGAPILALLPFGTIVDVLGSQSDDGWNEVNAAGRHGFVKSAYLDVSASPPLRGDAVVTPDDGVRLRSGPTVAAASIAVLPAGRVVHLQGDPSDDGWYPVRTQEGTGFVDGAYLQAISSDAAPILIRWYGHDFDGGILACGGRFSADDPAVAATTSYPCGTTLNVCAGSRCVSVVVRDHGRMGPAALDLSAAAFQRLATLDKGVLQGTAQVTTDAGSAPAGH
jgi:uncharacterized protein YraI